MKLFSMFSGYGGAEFALKKANIAFEVVGFSEIDKYAIQCYLQNHSNIHNYGDATKIDPEELPDFDLLTGGFPCQAFSVAGKGKGELDTRGTLFNDIIRIAEVKQPKYMLLENVKGLTNKTHRKTFEKILSELKRIGYDVTWNILNSKKHGIPQNRERVFFVCKLGMWDFLEFQWPAEQKLTLFLKDILEDEVDEKYYLSPERVDKLLNSTRHTSALQDKEYSYSLAARDYKEPKCVQINKPKHSNNRVYSDKGISPTLNTMQGGDRQPFIIDDTQGFDGVREYKDICPSLRSSRSGLKVKNATATGYQVATVGDGVNLEQPNSKTRRGRVQQQTSSTLQCNDERGVVTPELTIRKLTPKECFRLMGFLNDEINLEGISNTQQYKLAGNGWDINLVSKIFTEMFKEAEK